MLADRLSVNRVGGTALGGGTVMGLGALLLGNASFDEICALAARGDRRHVDMLVSDIYRPGEIALTGDLTAANFGKPSLRSSQRPRPEDVAAAIMGMVGENVALICAGLAAPHGLHHVVFGGSTLRDNPSLREVLRDITSAFGREPVFLERGEYAGAVGALELAAA
jgi:type II pantothenate kinase